LTIASREIVPCCGQLEAPADTPGVPLRGNTWLADRLPVIVNLG